MTRTLAAATIAALVFVPSFAESRPLKGEIALEYNAANRDHVRLAEQAQALRTGQRVDLDLQFDLEAGPERVASAGTARTRPMRRTIEIGDEAGQRLQELVCMTDINAPVNYTKQNYFRLRLFENFEHVTLKVYPGDKADFPRNDASCTLGQDAPTKKVFHLRGRFEAIVNSSPRGMIVQLRPVK